MLAIVGPTAAGKTALACALARCTGAEIISVDSMQVYRGMDIGTDKPTSELRAEIPHHGIDLIDPDESMSAGRFAAYAREVARGILSRGRPVILCGGTGLYARAFAGGLIRGVAADEQIRTELESRSLSELRAELEATDPVAAQRIRPRDRVRIIRALEVQRLAQRPISEQQDAHRFGDRPFDVRWIGLDLERTQLWKRIRTRVARMFERGLVDEVRALYAAGYTRSLRPLQAIGYREVGALLAGELEEAKAREAIFVATRRYARRQRTWFRAEPELVWQDGAKPEAALEAALRLLDPSPAGAGLRG